jgi:hypothetical protein
MQSRRAEPDTAIEESTISRPWDNSGLRHRVEGRAIDGVDVRSLQSSVVARSGTSSRRRRSFRERSPAASPQIELAQDHDREAP